MLIFSATFGMPNRDIKLLKLPYEYSYVLKNLHLSEEISKSSIRLCFSKYNTIEEINQAVDLIYQNYINISNT